MHAGAVELRNALNAAFGIELPATAILDYPTVEALAGHVASAMGPAIVSRVGEHMLRLWWAVGIAA